MTKLKDRLRTKAWVAKNRERHNAAVRRYRARRVKKEGRWRENGPKAKALSAFYAEVKGGPCTDCGERFPACCMDFDHRPGLKSKKGAGPSNVGTMVAHHYSIEKIKEEIEKCDLVCANCHRIRTRDRRIGSRRSDAV